MNEKEKIAAAIKALKTGNGNALEILEGKKERWYVDQPVLVSGSVTKTLQRFRRDRDRAFGHGAPSSVQGKACQWTHITPDHDAPSLPNWIEHDDTEKTVRADWILIITKDNNMLSFKVCAKLYKYDDWYCLINKPVFHED